MQFMQKTAIGSRSFARMLTSGHCNYRNLHQTLLVMKLTIVLLTAAFLQVHASGRSQTITLSGKDLSLKKVFDAIQVQTGFPVFSSQKIFTTARPVTISVADMPLKTFLDVVLKGQPVTYEII